MTMDFVKPFIGASYNCKNVKSNNISEFVKRHEYVKFSHSDSESNGYTFSEYNVSNLLCNDDSDEIFNKWVDSKVLSFSKLPSLYIYEVSYKSLGKKYCLRGIIGALKLPEKNDDYVYSIDYSSYGKLPSKLNSNLQTRPICALYEGRAQGEVLTSILKATKSSCLVRAKQNDVSYRLWEVSSDTDIKILLEFLNSKVYGVFFGIEYFTAVCAKKAAGDLAKKGENSQSYVMTLFIEKDEIALPVLPIHRIIYDLELFDGKAILKCAEKYFDLYSCKTLNSMRNKMFGLKRDGKDAFGFYADGEFSVLTIKQEILSDYSSEVGIEVFHKLFFDKVLKVNSNNIGFTQFDGEAFNAVESGEACFAVFFTAFRKSELYKIILSGKIIPAGSYSFFPGLPHGLIFHKDGGLE